MRIALWSFTVFCLLVACRPSDSDVQGYLVSLVADGRERTFLLNDSFTVDEFLTQPDISVTLDDNDRISPPRFTQLTDGMRITIVRVDEEIACGQEEIPYQREVVFNEGLAPSEERLVQVGQNGVQETCYRTILEDGIERERLPSGAPTVITAPVNELVIVGINQDVEPVPISGTLAYINNRNAWMIRGVTSAKQPLTTTGNLDSLVLSLSEDGRYLLYTAKPEANDEFINQLYLIRTAESSEPVQLVPTDVLYAEWKPREEDTISYSTAEAQDIFPFWRALNNVFLMRIDKETGRSLNVNQLVEENSGGLSGWWGTVYKWSPDGNTLAWVRADSLGIASDEGNLTPLIQYPIFRTTQNWSWRSSVSWSPESELLAITTHGDPVGNEPPEASPAFDISVTTLSGAFEADVLDAAGMWSSPQFSPAVNTNTPYPQGYLAYLRAREAYNSVNGEYDLVVADRDGSNARVIFPASTQPGIVSKDFGVAPNTFAWSPNATQIAVIYQGNLWVVDVSSGVAYQVTFDGQSENPVWSS